MEFDLNALQELPAEAELTGGSCGRTCTGTCLWTCFATGDA